MTYFATADTGHASGFADGERREIVVEHEALLLLALVGLQALLVIGGAERDSDQSLRLTAGEER